MYPEIFIANIPLINQDTSEKIEEMSFIYKRTHQFQTSIWQQKTDIFLPNRPCYSVVQVSMYFSIVFWTTTKGYS